MHLIQFQFNMARQQIFLFFTCLALSGQSKACINQVLNSLTCSLQPHPNTCSEIASNLNCYKNAEGSCQSRYGSNFLAAKFNAEYPRNDCRVLQGSGPMSSSLPGSACSALEENLLFVNDLRECRQKKEWQWGYNENNVCKMAHEFDSDCIGKVMTR